MKINNNKTTKILSATLAAMLITVSGIGTLVYATQSSENNNTKKAETSSAVSSEKIQELNDKLTLSKEETVYVLANADGSVKKIIVSDWLKNSMSGNTITDYTEMNDVTNVKGDQQYTLNPDNMRVWDSQGSDIFYHGTIEKTLPVDVSISFLLDGKSISAEELAGKSGKVTIRFDYKNNQKEIVEIAGKNEEIYVPFFMISGMILDNDNFKNIEISNGKIINDGDRNVVMGFALPGMQESLSISKDKFDIPSSVEIKADVTDFKLATTLTFATNDLFKDIKMDEVKNLDELKDSLSLLSDSSKKLVDGSSKLYDGLSTLLSKSKELIEGINKLTNGATALNEGAASLKVGTDELKNGMDSLASGLSSLTSNNSALNDGARTIFNSMLAMANTKLSEAGLNVPTLTMSNYSQVLNGILSSMGGDAIRQQVTQGVKAQESQIRKGVVLQIALVKNNVQNKDGKVMTVEEYTKAVAAGSIDSDTQTKISQAVLAIMQTPELQATIDQKTNEQMNLIIEQKISEAMGSVSGPAKQIADLKAQLDSLNQFCSGLGAYTSGVSRACAGSYELSEGTEKLSDGATKLSNGATELYRGLNQLENGSTALIDGVSQLKDGAMHLSDGMKEFNNKGIQKLIDAFDDNSGNIAEIVDRFKAISDVSKKYNNYGGIAENMEGNVKFIYKTDSIEKDE